MLTVGLSTQNKPKTSFGASERKVMNAVFNKPPGEIERIIEKEIRLHKYDEAYKTAKYAPEVISGYMSKKLRNIPIKSSGMEEFRQASKKADGLRKKTKGALSKFVEGLVSNVNARLDRIAPKK